jgi:hypothetical protein
LLQTSCIAAIIARRVAMECSSALVQDGHVALQQDMTCPTPRMRAASTRREWEASKRRLEDRETAARACCLGMHSSGSSSVGLLSAGMYLAVKRLPRGIRTGLHTLADESAACRILRREGMPERWTNRDVLLYCKPCSTSPTVLQASVLCFSGCYAENTLARSSRAFSWREKR